MLGHRLPHGMTSNEQAQSVVPCFKVGIFCAFPFGTELAPYALTCMRNARSASERIWVSMDPPELAIRPPLTEPPCMDPPCVEPDKGDSLPWMETADPPVEGLRQRRVFSWFVSPFLVDFTCKPV